MSIPEGKGPDKGTPVPADTYIKDPVTGRSYKVQPEQVEGYMNTGAGVISKAQAQAMAKAQSNVDYVDKNYSGPEQAAAGFGSGVTLGLGPAALKALGLADPGHLDALEGTGAFQAGDVAGMLAPAILSGGEGLAARGAVAGAEAGERGVIATALAGSPAGLLNRAGSGAERLLGAVLPETGIAGKLATPALKLAGRGAAEGAIINLAHTTSDNIIHDKPFTTQAMAASAADGALFGSLAAGALGGFGAALGAGSEAAFGTLAGTAGKGERGADRAIRRLGGEAGDFTKIRAGEAGLDGTIGSLKGYGQILENKGASFASKDSVIAKVAQETVSDARAIKNGVVETLDKEAPNMTPELSRVEGRILEDMKAQAPIAQGKIASAFKGLQSDLDPLAAPKAPMGEASTAPVEPMKPATSKDPNVANDYRVAKAKYDSDLSAWKAENKARSEVDDTLRAAGSGGSWKGWIDSRERLAEMVSGSEGVKRTVYESALNAFDSEIKVAMSSAADHIGQTGLAEQFQSATIQQRLASELDDMISRRIGKKAAAGSGLHINGGDVGALAYGSLMGHPLGAAGIVAGKKVVLRAQSALEPAMAEAAYRMAIGSRAAAAGAEVNGRITSKVKAFIKGTGVGASREATASMADSGTKGRSMADFQADMAATEKLLDYTHKNKVDQYVSALTQAGHPDMAEEASAMYQRATEYLNFNRPNSQAVKKAGSLGKLPAPFGLSTKEMKFLRLSEAVKNPMLIVDGLTSGQVSRDQVMAVKYVYPELHQKIVDNTMTAILEMKAAGETIPADKIAMLGLVLDAPIDSKLEKGYIDQIQQAHEANNQPPPAPKNGPPTVNVTDYQTPMQQSMS